MDVLRAYLSKQKCLPGLAAAPAHPELTVVVVIPCHDEPDLLQTLTSLRGCRRARGAVEIMLVCNASEADDGALRQRNRIMMEQVHAWRARHEDPRFRIHALNFPRLPARHAGVGLARKIGMDAAVARFVSAGKPDGVIASLDADCTCDSNYLAELESHFERNPNTRACTIYFEHALNGPLEEGLYQAITRYELFLRYYRHGMRSANFPFFHYTLGSCLAVRCIFYARHGGMNRRKAGEDFYFLNKLIAVGGVSENNATRVMPGVRASTRTPFGTGRALHDWLNTGREPWKSYDARVFRDLAALVCAVDDYYELAPGAWRASMPLSDCMQAFLLDQGMLEKHAEIRRNCACRRSFRKRFFQWFDGFRALKFIHYATADTYPRQPLEQACRTLLAWQGAVEEPDTADARSLLMVFRNRDRSPLDPTAVVGSA
ncbi:MAG: glycosyltransferase [Lysobacterales bacterium]|nr:MAG: glycosyltransferase [Xanthomonadales bacterium]